MRDWRRPEPFTTEVHTLGFVRKGTSSGITNGAADERLNIINNE